MKFTLPLIIICTIGFTASAQFWKRKPKPQPVEERSPLLTEVKAHSVISFTHKLNIRVQDIHDLQLPCSNEALELSEDNLLNEAKHNLRFRIYNLASYNFSDLAAFYIFSKTGFRKLNGICCKAILFRASRMILNIRYLTCLL